MAFLRPSADDGVGGWTTDTGATTNLYAAIDEVVADDLDYIQSSVNPSNDKTRHKLSLGGPLSEPFTLRFRYHLHGVGKIRFKLVQGAATEIVSWDETAQDAWTPTSQTLTSPQFALITNQDDLYIEAIAAPPAGGAVLDLDLSTTLPGTVTFSRTTVGTYVNSSGLIASAAIDAARFDHSPISPFTARGLLVEEQRTNYCKTDMANFALAAVSRTADAATAPDGNTDADLVTDTAGAGAHYLYFTVVGTGIGTGALDLGVSCYFKAGTHNFIFVTYAGEPANCWVAAVINLSTGAITQTAVGAASGKIISATTESLGGGWYRLHLVATVTTSSNSYIEIGFADAGTGNTFDGYGVPSSTGTGSRTFQVWMPQVERGASVTSPIVDFIGGTVRAADVSVMTGANFSSWWNAAAGTFVVDFDLFAASGTRPIISVDDTTAAEQIRLYGSGVDPKVTVADAGGTPPADLDAGTLLVQTLSKIGLSFAANDFAACFRGGIVDTETSGTLPTVSRLLIGHDQASNYLTGHVSRVQFFNIATSDAELQTLTAPAIADPILTFRDKWDTEIGSANFTTSIDIGTASADRLVVVTLACQDTVTSVEVNNVVLTKIVEHAGDGYTAIWAGLVTTGTGAVDVEILGGGAFTYRTGSVYTLNGLSSTTVKATRTQEGTISVTAGDLFIASMYDGSPIPNLSASTQTPTERHSTLYGGPGASADMTIAAANAFFLVDCNSPTPGLCVATWR